MSGTSRSSPAGGRWSPTRSQPLPGTRDGNGWALRCSTGWTVIHADTYGRALAQVARYYLRINAWRSAAVTNPDQRTDGEQLTEFLAVVERPAGMAERG